MRSESIVDIEAHLDQAAEKILRLEEKMLKRVKA